MDRTFSHYRVEEEIGRGGMGVVYRAVDTRLGRPVAVKVLAAEATADPDRLLRFVHEARSASALNHPHIVTIHDIDEAEGTTFIVMELVDGTPLDRLLAQGPMASVAAAVDYGAQIASALEAAHASGLVHRDVKPANIIITGDGRAKVVDFGLAKLIERAPAESTMTALGTMPGLVLGTAAYMSPEQAEGRPVDGRSDIFSLGAVLYEMLAGRRAFAGASDIGLITAILRDQPPPLRSLRQDVPGDVQGVVDRCLAKKPDARYARAGEVKRDLDAIRGRLTRPPEPGWRRPAVLVPAAIALLAVAGIGIWQAVESRRRAWVRDSAIPEIEQLENGPRTLDAVRLAGRVEPEAPDAIAGVRQRWLPLALATVPTGAHVELRDYLDVDGPWYSVGDTPLDNVRLPYGYHRVRIAKEGYVPLELGVAFGRPPLKLIPESEAEPGMVPVGGGTVSVGVAGTVTLPDFWIDRLEVTNREYKEFVDAGGYRDAKYWKEPFRAEGHVLGFTEAIGRFRDSTGRIGPASWELGTYPEGQADFPVGGISWFEASAYAVFAGKTLPSVHHWYRAANVDELSSDIVRVSNLDGKRPVKAGERPGLGPWGTLDMAGNVKEWCANSTETPLRYVLGGGWDEPAYRYMEPDAQDPWLRRPTFGVRLVKNSGPVDPSVLAPVRRVMGDPASVVPVSDELFEVYKRFYDYDRSPLNARVDEVDDTAEYWRREVVSFDAAYGHERIPAQLFLPRNTAPPYQTVVLFPSAYATFAPSSEVLDYLRFDFIVRGGRALLYPIYQGTFERRNQQPPPGPSARRDLHVQWAKDFFRSVDYLATRKDIDMDRLAYYSLSMGAYFGPIPVSLEPRIKVAVFASGGLRFNYPPEIQPANFAPHVTVPVLLVNGRDDFQAPLPVQQRFLDLFGTAPEHKRHVALEGGHVPTDMRGMIREVLDWFDTYLGPVGHRRP